VLITSFPDFAKSVPSIFSAIRTILAFSEPRRATIPVLQVDP
jgi:hypothetical protein